MPAKLIEGIELAVKVWPPNDRERRELWWLSLGRDEARDLAAEAMAACECWEKEAQASGWPDLCGKLNVLSRVAALLLVEGAAAVCGVEPLDEPLDVEAASMGGQCAAPFEPEAVFVDEDADGPLPTAWPEPVAGEARIIAGQLDRAVRERDQAVRERDQARRELDDELLRVEKARDVALSELGEACDARDVARQDLADLRAAMLVAARAHAELRDAQQHGSWLRGFHTGAATLLAKHAKAAES